MSIAANNTASTTSAASKFRKIGQDALTLPNLSKAYLLLYLFLNFTALYRVLPAKGPIAMTTYLAFPAMIIARDTDFKRRLKAVYPIFPYILIFLLWGLLVTPNFQDVVFRASVQSARIILAFGTVVALVRDRRTLAIVCEVVQIGAVVTALICLYQTANPHCLSSFSDETGLAILSARPAAAWGNANVAGIHFTIALILSLWARPSIAWCGRLAAIFGTIMSASRGAIVSEVVFFGIYLVVMTYVNMRGQKRGWPMMVAATSLGVLAFVAAPEIPTLLAGLTVRGLGSSRSVEIRVEHLFKSEELQGRGIRVWLLEQWTDLALEAPPQGYGIYTSLGSAYNAGSTNIGPRLGPHNMFLAIWADDGFLMMAAFTVVLFIQIFKYRRYDVDFQGRLIIFLFWVSWILTIIKTHNCFDSDEWAFFWAVLCIVPLALDKRRNPA